MEVKSWPSVTMDLLVGLDGGGDDGGEVKDE